MSYKGPMRLAQGARRAGEKAFFTKKRQKDDRRNKLAKAARKKNR